MFFYFKLIFSIVNSPSTTRKHSITLERMNQPGFSVSRTDRDRAGIELPTLQFALLACFLISYWKTKFHLLFRPIIPHHFFLVSQMVMWPRTSRRLPMWKKCFHDTLVINHLMSRNPSAIFKRFFQVELLPLLVFSDTVRLGAIPEVKEELTVGTWILLHDVEGLDGSGSQHGGQRGWETVALARQALETRKAVRMNSLAARHWILVF